MKKISIYLFLSLFTISLSANSKGNIVDRKKNFDSKAKFLISMQEIITSEKLNKDLQGLKDMMSEVDTTYRSGEKDKIKKKESFSLKTMYHHILAGRELAKKKKDVRTR